MDYKSSMTLGDPEFPPKNGVIIKQGDIFVQESRRFLFAKWKVWRKRFVTLRYRAKAATSLLQIDPPNALVMSSVSYTLTSGASTEIIDSSGPQDLATAKVLQLIIDEHSEPVTFKHENEDEMNDWLAAFRLVSALGETSSICSDTDSSTWTCSQAAASPVIVESPITSFPLDIPTVFSVRLVPCPTQQELGLSVNCDYELHIDSHEFSLRVASGTTNPSSKKDSQVAQSGVSAWPLSAVHKLAIEDRQQEAEKATANAIHISIMRPGNVEESQAHVLTILPLEEPTKLYDKLKGAVAHLHNGDHRSTESEHSILRNEKSSGSKRRPASERIRKKPLLSLIQQSSLISSSEQLSPVLPRAAARDRPFNPQSSARRSKRITKLAFADSRESSGSGDVEPYRDPNFTGNEWNY